MNLYNNLKGYVYPSEDKHYQSFISEQKKLLKSSHLTPQEKKIIQDRIDKLKIKSKINDKKYFSTQLSSTIVVSIAGFIAGPVAVGLATALTQETRSPQKVRDMYKARKCGKVRIKVKKSKQKIKGPTPIIEGISATIWSLVCPIGHIFKSAVGFGYYLFK